MDRYRIEAKKNIRKRKQKSKRFIVFTKIWALAYIVIFLAFCGYFIWSGVLPVKVLLLVLGMIGIVSLGLFLLIYVKKVRKPLKVIAIILSVGLAAAYGYIVVNLSDTLDFLSRVTDLGAQYEQYYVVTTKNSTYTKLRDIEGDTVTTLSGMDSNYGDARSQLEKKYGVSYSVVNKVSDAGKAVKNGSSQAALLSAGHYHFICESEKGFKAKTRILGTIYVRLSSSDLSKNVNVTKRPYNIYISGLDVNGKIDVTSRSDVNMIVTVNPKTHTILLTSIPRDYQIHLVDKNNASDKLTHTGIYGIRETLVSVEDLTGLDLNYYLKVNYTTVRKFIDAIGGVDVNSDFAFSTHGQRYYAFKKGRNHLDGREALAFARERKSFVDGDVQRNRNQEKIMEAILKKASSSRTILSRYSKILDSCKDYMQINLSSDEIRSIIKMQLSGGYNWKIYKQNFTGTGSSQKCYSSGDYYTYVMKPDSGSLERGTDNIKAVQEGEPVTKKQLESVGKLQDVNEEDAEK